MGELLESISQWLKERTTSPLYGTYIFSFIIWNWEFFYVLFLQDQASLPLPKIEYIEQKFLSDGWFVHFSFFLIPPVIITYIIIRWLPFLSNWAHRVYLHFYFERKNLYEETNLHNEEGRKRTLQQLAETKEQQAISKMKIRKNITNEERWEEEYNEFAKGNIFGRFSQIIDAVYEKSGYLYVDNEGKKPVDSDILAGSDTRGLISFTDSGRNQIDLTEKGKFFTKKYLDNPPPPELPF